MDQYNRQGLEKSIGQYDQTHNFKVSYVWELPFLKGNRVFGGWRLSGIHMVNSGTPLDLANSNVYNIFNGRSAIYATTLEGWNANNADPNWLGNDRFFQPRSFFGAQPANRLGTTTRHNPKRAPFRTAPTISLSPSGSGLPYTSISGLRLSTSANTPRFTTGSRNIDDPNFGVVRSQLNEPRRMQFALRLYF